MKLADFALVPVAPIHECPLHGDAPHLRGECIACSFIPRLVPTDGAG